MQEQINNSSMLKVGTILRGTYRIDSYLSSGGFGNTYVATNIEFDERVAIKEFFMKGVTQRDENQTTVSVSNAENHNSFLEQKEKFKKEARRLRKLKNEYIVRVHDLFEENGTAYYVMDYVDGENLAERLKHTGQPMSEKEIREILPQILDALKSVHGAGIWHLDLKPANIMLTKEGKVKLIDFGASKQMNAQKGGATTSTAISYTNGYAPREQMEQNYDKFGSWTDIYALGATLYALLTKKRPPLPTDIDDDVSEDKHTSLPLPDSTSEEMKSIIIWMMQTNRNQRPHNIQDIINSYHQRYDQELDEATIVSKVTPENNNDKQMAGKIIPQNPPSVSHKESRTRKRIVWYSAIIILLFVVGAILLCPFNSFSNSSKIEIISEQEKTCRIVAEIQDDNQGPTKILPFINADLTGSYSIPEKIDGYTVTEIGDYAFQYTQIRQIIIPKTVKSIGNRAFANSKLHDITIEKNIETIGHKAFYMCQNLEHVKIESCPIIEDEAFSFCTNLMDLEVSSSNIRLYEKTFYSINSFTKLLVPAGMKQEFVKKGWDKYFFTIGEINGQDKVINSDNKGFDYDKWVQSNNE